MVCLSSTNREYHGKIEGKAGGEKQREREVKIFLLLLPSLLDYKLEFFCVPILKATALARRPSYIHSFLSEVWKPLPFLAPSCPRMIISVPFVSLGVCTVSTHVLIAPSLNSPQSPFVCAICFLSGPCQHPATQHLPQLGSAVAAREGEGETDQTFNKLSASMWVGVIDLKL